MGSSSLNSPNFLAFEFIELVYSFSPDRPCSMSVTGSLSLIHLIRAHALFGEIISIVKMDAFFCDDLKKKKKKSTGFVGKRGSE